VHGMQMSFLKKHGYLEPDSLKSGTLSWSSNGRQNGSISIEVSTKEPDAYLRLVYTITDRDTNDKQEVDYKISLVKVNSNLGKGYRYYFLCPFTDKRCIILYKVGGYQWKHREAFNNLFYDSQLTPKSMRPFMILVYDRKQRDLRESRTKNGKRINSHYRGQPTKFLKKLDRLQFKGYKSVSMYEEFLK
jgi:hypothetical protein